MSEVKLSFEMKRIKLPLADILPTRSAEGPQCTSKRLGSIRASIKELGVIEPLVVCPIEGTPGKYLLFDGHLRFVVLKELGESEAECIIAGDGSSFSHKKEAS